VITLYTAAFISFCFSI